ncbi:MAG TPA: electron transfer flavoprotein-ubiquinone oxidoreductase [Polyangiaceae bacterium]|nr:electron transfer flavoprotein-ubiquinone oxidoreductase [Polyangiaceae bacterium]
MLWIAFFGLLGVVAFAATGLGLLAGDPHAAPRRHVKLVRPKDYNEEAKDDGTEREVMEVDAVFVGGGPAGLAGAYHLMQLCKKHDEAIEKGEKKGDKLGEVQICVLEKCSEIGAMGISGLVLDPKALKELIPDFEAKGAPLDCKVEKESMHFLLSPTLSAPSPIMPLPLQDHGLYIASLSKLVRWMAGLCEAEGVMMFPGFAGAYMMYDGDKVVGVQTGDKGIGHDGEKKRSFEPGVQMKAKVTVLTEGTRGSLTRDVTRKLKLDAGKNPNSYCLGVKEIIEVPAGQVPAGEVMLTAGWPLGDKTYGGSFMYSMKDNLVALGLMVGLDYADPNTDPQVLLQRMKMHPQFQKYLKGGKVIQYGAKTVPLGGYYAMPKAYADGLLLAGDSAGLVNAERLKGVHLAIKSGMLAAETVFEAMIAKDSSEKTLSSYEKKLKSSWIEEEMYKARDFHANFHDGLAVALIKNGPAGTPVIGPILGPLLGSKSRTPVPNDFETKRTLSEVGGLKNIKEGIPYDGKLFMDKLSDVYLAGSKGEEDQPSHLQVLNRDVCSTECADLYGNPCTRACPANVYEMVEDESKPGRKKLHLNPTNCVHCKTCDLIDPYINIRWVVPEGGDGPNYSQM